jgi:hypothetical protein
MSMNWLFPGFLVGTAALALPILLHLMRRRPKRTISFPSLRFLMASQQQNDKSQRLRRWLVLVLRCAALALLAAAFARPFFGASSNGERQAVVVVIDNSFSLQAGHRWMDLRQWAQKQIGETAPGDKLGLLLMAPRPTWLAPLNTNPQAALALLEKLSPSWESARAEPALRLAADTLAAAPVDRRRLIYLGDHQRVSWAGFDFGKKIPAGVRAVFPGVPTPLARQAALRAPTVARTAEGFRATLPIQNFTGAQKRTLRVFRDGAPTPTAQQTITLAQRATETFQIDLPAGGAADSAYFRITLDEDDLPADDEAYAVWQASGERAVLLDPSPSSSGTDYVGAALASSAKLKPSMQIVPLPTTAWPPQAVAVLRNDASFAGEGGTRLSTFLRAGGTALIFVDGSSAQSAWFQTAAGLKLRALKADRETLEVRDWAMDHPLVTGLAAHSVRALLDWKFRRGCALPVDAVEPIALWSESGAAIGETSGNAGRMLICGFAPDRRNGEWPGREMFVPFVHRAVAYLLGSQTGGSARLAQVGESLVLPSESGTWRALVGPAVGTTTEVRGGTAIPPAPGVFVFNFKGQRKLIAVNLAPEESDPAAWSDGTPWENLVSDASVAASGAPRTAMASAEAEQRAPLWWWLAAAMAIVMLAELGLANRTTR